MDILLIEDHAINACGLTRLLREAVPGARVHEASSASEAIRLGRAARQLGLVVAAHNLLEDGKVASLATLKALFSGTPLVVACGLPQTEAALSALEAGAAGYLPRTMRGDAIVAALRLVLTGERYVPSLAIEGWHQTAIMSHVRRIAAEGGSPISGLTPRQREILAMVAHGASNKVIARALSVHEVTVKSHLRVVYRALGVNTRTEAARKALLAGLDIDPGHEPGGIAAE
ncbi:MAG: LuxR C-terminal-related transcriptional regulator [Actinomycetota bacterium]